MKSAIFSAVAVVFTLPALVHGGVILADSAQENVVINNNRIHVGDEPDLGSTRFVGWGPFVGTSWEVSFSLPRDWLKLFLDTIELDSTIGGFCDLKLLREEELPN